MPGAQPLKAGGMKGRLAVVDVALRDDTNEVVGVEINRISGGSWNVVSHPAQDRPGSWPEKILSWHVSERILYIGVAARTAAIICLA